MFRKAVFLAVLLVALSVGSAFAYQIDSLQSGSNNGAAPAVFPPTQVFVNPGGLGDVLLYGYYNVRGKDQFFTITNTDTNNGARVRIRFREAATIVYNNTGTSLSDAVCNGSQEVLDFDICLSEADVWSGRITTGSDGAGRLFSDDDDTYVQTSGVAGDPTGNIVIFADAYPNGVGFKYGAANTINTITADQTREGYFEVIAQRQLSESCDHIVNNATPDCTCGDLLDVTNTDVRNVLMGHTYIVDLSTSTTFGYVATSLGDFALADITGPTITSARPNLAQDSETGIITPVNYALTKQAVYTVYDLDPTVDGKTSLIVTFPTKWATHDESYSTSQKRCTPDADDIFDDMRVLITIYDDEENSFTAQCDFSPCPPGQATELKHEVNVVDINNTGAIFTSDVAALADTHGYIFGWMYIDLLWATSSATAVPTHQTVCTVGTCAGAANQTGTALGLPAIGYVAHMFAGGDVSGMLPLQYSSNTQ